MASTKNKARTQQRQNRRRGAYLTKRILISAARSGVKDAVESTIRVMGYNVIALNGRVVRKYEDGRIEDIAAIEQAKPVNGRILLD